MANPSWSADNITFHTLLGYYLLGGKPVSSMEEQVVKKTDNGGIFVYLMYTRRTIDIKFLCNNTQLASHLTLHTTVAGYQFPFYFSLTGAGSFDSIFMRKQAGFDPTESPQKARIPGFGSEVLYEVVYHFEEEIV